MTVPTVLVPALAMVVAVLWPGASNVRLPAPGETSLSGDASRPVRRRRRASGQSPEEVEAGLAELLALVAAPLRAGVSPSSSVAAAASAVAGDPVVGDLTRRLAAAGRAGDDVAEVWRGYGPGGDAAAFVARAWALSERTGAPLADALGAAEQVLRARRRTRQRLDSAAAGPRASMVVLALLPLSGPVVGLACGISLRELFLQSPLALASLGLGLLLAGVAWTWSRAILARASA